MTSIYVVLVGMVMIVIVSVIQKVQLRTVLGSSVIV